MHKKLRIGFVSVEDASDVHSWSGIPFQVLSAMRANDVHVELLSPLRRNLKFALTPSILMAKAKKRGFLIDHSPLLLASYARQLQKMLKTRDVDVIFSMSSIPITDLECSQPLVFWTDSVFHFMIGYYGSVFRNMSYASLERGRRQEEKALQKSSAVVYASEWAAAGARTLVGNQKVHVLPFGSSLTNEETAEDVAQRAREKRSLGPKKCNLLFVGVDWERKGGDVAVNTVKILEAKGWEVTLRIVGVIPPYEVPDSVESLGFISKSTEEGRQRLTQLYKEADVFLLPTKAEAAGIVFCEASAFGLPAVTYDTGGVGEYVHNGKNGVSLPEGSSAASFAEEIELLLVNPEAYVALCVSSLYEYKTRLNWHASVKKLVDLCRDVTLSHEAYMMGMGRGTLSQH